MFSTTDFINQPVQENLPSIFSALKYGFKAYAKNFLKLMLVVVAILLVGYCDDEFVIIDRHDESDIFTYQEIRPLIFLWDESFKVKVNTIIME